MFPSRGMMDSEMATIEERLKSFNGQLQAESAVLERMVYKNKNQHRRCSYFQYLLKVRRDLKLLKSAKLDELLTSCFEVISGAKPKQKVYRLESLKRTKREKGKYNFMERLLGASRLLSQMVELILKAATEISILPAQSFFTGFSVIMLALLARLRILVQQILLDVVSVFNTVSTLSQQKQSVKLFEDGIEAYAEYYPTNDDFCLSILFDEVLDDKEPVSDAAHESPSSDQISVDDFCLSILFDEVLDDKEPVLDAAHESPSSDQISVDDFYLSILFDEVLDDKEPVSDAAHESPSSDQISVDDFCLSILFDEVLDDKEPVSDAAHESPSSDQISIDDFCLSILFDEVLDDKEPVSDAAHESPSSDQISVDDFCLSILFDEVLDDKEPVSDAAHESPSSDQISVDDFCLSILFDEVLDDKEPVSDAAHESPSSDQISVDDFCLSILFDEVLDDKEPVSDAAHESPSSDQISVDDFCLSILFDEVLDDKEPVSDAAHESPSSDQISVDDFYFSLLFDEALDDKEPVSDERYAEELQFQEALLSSIITASHTSTTLTVHANHAPKPKSGSIEKMKQVLGQSSHEFCEICVEKKDSEDMFSIPTCSHSFCIECVTKYIATRIQDNITQVNCPAWNCEGYLQLDSCRPLVPKDVIERWEDALCESMLLGQRRIYCPFKGCSAMLVADNDDEEIGEVECPYCNRLFCARCNTAWHTGVDCEEWKTLRVDEKGREDLMLRELAKNNRWKRCPKCRFYVERTSGCPHMTCRCKFQFCYGCGAEWGKVCGGCSK